MWHQKDSLFLCTLPGLCERNINRLREQRSYSAISSSQKVKKTCSNTHPMMMSNIWLSFSLFSRLQCVVYSFFWFTVRIYGSLFAMREGGKMTCQCRIDFIFFMRAISLPPPPTPHPPPPLPHNLFSSTSAAGLPLKGTMSQDSDISFLINFAIL